MRFFGAYFCRHRRTSRQWKKHTTRTCVIFLCFGCDVTASLIQSNQSSLYAHGDNSAISVLFHTHVKAVAEVVQHIAWAGKKRKTRLFSVNWASVVCVLTHVSPSPLSRPRVSQCLCRFSLSASGLYEYLASSRTRTHTDVHAGSCISLPNPHLKKGI